MRKPTPISVFTGSRADYGLLHPLLVGLVACETIEPTLLIGGDHFGNVSGFLEAIEMTALKHRVLMPLHKGEKLLPQSLSKRMYTHQKAMTKWIHAQTQPPQLLVILGDRLEAMGVALAGFAFGIPILHLAAGDTTTGGCVDDRLRFAISSLATATVSFSQNSHERILKQGLVPETHALHTASLSVDNALSVSEMSREEFCHSLGLNSQLPFLIFTQHPVPAEGEETLSYLKASLEALASLEGIQVLATTPNSDAFHKPLKALIQETQVRFPQIKWVENLGFVRYIQALRHCAGVVGNSSSGLYETPLFNVPCLNIGTRQANRERANNVIDCAYGVESVKAGLHTLLRDEAFLKSLQQIESPFGSRPATPEIITFIQQVLEI